MASILQVFAKAPVPGSVKTRLIPPLDAVGAADLHRALVERTLTLATGAVSESASRLELWCAPDASHPFFTYCANRFPLTLRTQRGADLGSRMHDALHNALERGDRPVLIGTDCPALDREQIAEAFSRLAPGEADVVLLPTEDGGYALFGATRVDQTLFDGITWSTGTVFEETAARISALGWTLHRMATGWDVDRPEDLQRLRALMTGLPTGAPAG